MAIDIGSAIVGCALGFLAGGMVIVSVFMWHFRKQRRRHDERRVAQEQLAAVRPASLEELEELEADFDEFEADR